MSEFKRLREAADTLASRTPSPDFGELKRRASRRSRRRVAITAAAVVALIAGSALAAQDLIATERTGTVAQPTLSATATPTAKPTPTVAPPPSVKPATAPNGWVAVEAGEGGDDIYLVRPGDDPRQLEVAGSDAADDACPVWSPDGTRLLLGRVTEDPDSSSNTTSDPRLVIVPIGQDGTAGTPQEIALDGFDVFEGFDTHPCATWAPDGRWVAFAGTGEVWLVDTKSGAIRRLPNLRPTDLEWRPGTDELTIAGDLGANRVAERLSTPVTLYSVSTGKLRRLGSINAAEITWSPDGATLAYTGGERDSRELALVDSAGTNERSLVADVGRAIQGIGPVWSPTGDRIAYQRCVDGASVSCNGERHEVVLVSVTDGTEAVIEPPKADGQEWYPFSVSWSRDGATLLYTAWNQVTEGLLAVPADKPSDRTVLIEAVDPADYYSHPWSTVQMWGRQPR